jgi:hypothetical protein
MNGPIAFSKTLRALDADSFSISNLLLLSAVALLAAWIFWFLRAGVPQYEISRDVQIQPNRVIATFPPRVLERVRPGEPARLLLDGEAIPARVIAIGIDASGGQARAILLPQTESPVPAASHAEAAVEVERVSPATLLLRAAGGARR